MSRVSNQVPVFEAYRGLKIYFLAVLAFILAEDEIAREIMSFLQFMFSLASKAKLLVGRLPSVSQWGLSRWPLQHLLHCSLGHRVLRLEETTAGYPHLSGLGWASLWVSMEAVAEVKPRRNWSLFRYL